MVIKSHARNEVFRLTEAWDSENPTFICFCWVTRAFILVSLPLCVGTRLLRAGHYVNASLRVFVVKKYITAQAFDACATRLWLLDGDYFVAGYFVFTRGTWQKFGW